MHETNYNSIILMTSYVCMIILITPYVYAIILMTSQSLRTCSSDMYRRSLNTVHLTVSKQVGVVRLPMYL